MVELGLYTIITKQLLLVHTSGGAIAGGIGAIPETAGGYVSGAVTWVVGNLFG